MSGLVADSSSGITTYNLSAGKSTPQWMQEKLKGKSLRYDDGDQHNICVTIYTAREAFLVREANVWRVQNIDGGSISSRASTSPLHPSAFTSRRMVNI